MANIEERLTVLEKRLRYHRITVGILALFIMLLVGTRVGANSGEITCTQLRMVNSEGATLVALSSTRDGFGAVTTFSPEGKKLLALGTATGGNGSVRTFSPEGKELVALATTTGGDGGVWTTTKSGRSKRLG